MTTDPESEITVTLGATEAIFSAIQAVVGAGDEVIAFDPAYDSYEPAVRLAGGRCVRLPLAQPGFRYDWERVRAALNARTRLVLLNSPHNPACTVASGADLDALAAVIRDRDILVLADEVYEHVVFDGAAHHSVLTHPELAARSFAVFSFGKTLHATGLRIGYCVAPRHLTDGAAQGAPVQHLQHRPSAAARGGGLPWRTAGLWARARRVLPGEARSVAQRAAGTAASSLPKARRGPTSSCWISVVFSRDGDLKFADELLTHGGVASDPLSPFYAVPEPLSFVRLCLAKRDSTLDEGAARLNAFAARRNRN